MFGGERTPSQTQRLSLLTRAPEIPIKNREIAEKRCHCEAGTSRQGETRGPKAPKVHGPGGLLHDFDLPQRLLCCSDTTFASCCRKLYFSAILGVKPSAICCCCCCVNTPSTLHPSTQLAVNVCILTSSPFPSSQTFLWLQETGEKKKTVNLLKHLYAANPSFQKGLNVIRLEKGNISEQRVVRFPNFPTQNNDGILMSTSQP